MMGDPYGMLLEDAGGPTSWCGRRVPGEAGERHGNDLVGGMAEWVLLASRVTGTTWLRLW